MCNFNNASVARRTVILAGGTSRSTYLSLRSCSDSRRTTLFDDPLSTRAMFCSHYNFWDDELFLTWSGKHHDCASGATFFENYLAVAKSVEQFAPTDKNRFWQYIMLLRFRNSVGSASLILLGRQTVSSSVWRGNGCGVLLTYALYIGRVHCLWTYTLLSSPWTVRFRVNMILSQTGVRLFVANLAWSHSNFKRNIWILVGLSAWSALDEHSAHPLGSTRYNWRGIVCAESTSRLYCFNFRSLAKALKLTRDSSNVWSSHALKTSDDNSPYRSWSFGTFCQVYEANVAIIALSSSRWHCQVDKSSS